MLKKLSFLTLAFSCLLLVVRGAVTITSFSPTSAAVGTTVTINGTNFTGATVVSFGGTAAASFSVVSATQITAVVGNGSNGSVSVTSPSGTGSLAGFTVAAPTISSFTPTSSGNGLSVVITGSNLTGATVVSFGGTAATSFVVNSATQITAVVGAGTSGSVSVTTPGGTISKTGFTWVAAPTITSFSPSSAGPTMAVVITGTNFTGATAVSFGGTAATSYTVNSATQITATVGAGTSGSVLVTTPGGTISKTGFTWVAAPTITSFTPTSAGPTISVVITGTNFTAATAVSFGGTAATSYTVNSATQITATVGAGTSGSVLVTTAGGTATLAGFTWVAAPTITSFSPTSAGPTMSVVITGTNLTGATAVSFGGTAATSYTVNSATQITATVGAGTSGSVSVTTAGGTVTKTGFTWVAAPTITSFTPTSSGTGLTVTITGTNLTGATAVSFGGTAATSYTVVSATSITAVVAGGTSGSVVVTTPGGTSTLAGFTYVAAPTISSFSPTSALVGTTITITGTNFTGATAVSFGGTAATSFTVVSATSIKAVVGSGTNGSVAVTTPGGTATIAGFTIPAPSITSFTPTSGIAGTSVTITGTNFTGATAVAFGGTGTASYTVNSNTSITAVIGTGTSGSVSVTTPGGSASLAGFTFTPQTGFIYVHQKDINEESAVDFNFSLINNAGTATYNWNLNDQATANNVALSGSNLYIYDIGVGHGTTGDGELWVIAGSSTTNVSNTGGISGTVYHRLAGASTWSTLPTSVTTATAIDGAWSNQFVYALSGSSNVYFYNNGTSTTLPTVGATVTDVTCNNGRIAAMAGGTIYLYSLSYDASTAPGTGGTWSSLVVTGNTSSRMDMNLGATLITYTIPGSNTIRTVDLSGNTASLGAAGDAASGATVDIAYDDNNNVYTTCHSNTNGGTDVVASYNGSTWTTEPSARKVMRLTGGAAKQVYGVENIGASGFPQAIWFRALDNTGTAYWIDDERIKNSSSLNGNGILIPVTAGTYTVQETLPSASWDLGRFNLYDPGNASTPNVSANSASVTVTAGEVVYVEFVNELLNAKAIALSCTQQVLQSFDLNDFGGGTYGTPLQGTAYHDYPTGIPEDGYYILTKSTASNWYSNPGITDHSGNSGYFLLVNSSYAKDEFYRQRVTNLVPGLSYIISFYASNVSSGSPVTPSISYGLQDLNGNIVTQAYSGDFPKDNVWHYYSFTFTATTSTADLFLRNQTIGGNGNDLGLDDISINPVITPLPTINVSPTIAPNVCIGTNYTFSNTQTGGVWTSSPSSVATINAKSGKARGLTAGSAAITYTYTNAIGCVSTNSTGIIVSAPPAVTAYDLLSGTSCLNQTDSLYSTLTASGTGTITYAWVASPATNAGLGTANIANTIATPTTPGTYNYVVTVTDAVGCTASSNGITLTVSANTAPVVTAGSTGPYCADTSFTLTSSATGGSGSYTYAWSATPTGNGLNATTNTQNIKATPTPAGTYTYKVVVNDGFCNVPKFVTVIANSKPTVTITGPGSTTICNGGTISLTSTPTGGTAPYTYSWAGTNTPTNNGGLIVTTVQTPSAKPAAGTYTYSLTITDANGCTASNSANATVAFNANSSNLAISAALSPSTTNICAGTSVGLNATITTAGLANYTYVWSGGLGTITGASSGSTSALTYNTATVSTSTITTATTGSFTLTVTDSKGCVVSANTPSLTVNPKPAVAVSRFAATLCSNTVDTVYATASAGTSPYTYLWTSNSSSGGFTIANATNPTTPLTSGSSGTTYTLTMTVTDAKSCTATGSTTVLKSGSAGPTLVTMSPASAGTICINVVKNISGTVSGGTSPYTYAWSGSPTNNGIVVTNASSTTAKPTAAGTYTYTVVVTDNNGCALANSTGAQTVNSAISVSPAASAPGFCGTNSSLTVVAAASGGSGTYSNYVWGTTVVTLPGTTTVNPTSSTSSASTTATIAGATAGTSTFQYTATVTDNAGCTGAGSTSILTVGTGFTAITKPTATMTSACVGQTITISSSNFTGGNFPINYTWTGSSGATITTSSGTLTSSPSTVPGTTASASTAGNYSFGLLVVDNNNCIDSASTNTLTITQVSPSISTTCGSTNGVEWVQFLESNGASWAWTTTSSGRFYTDANLSPATDGTTSTLQAPYVTFLGTYSVAITDANGCTGSGTYTITPTTCAVTLAVSGLDFTAQKQGSGALLTWSTKTETNNSHFDVERSSDGTNWQVIGTVAGKGNSTTLTKYSFTDAMPLNGINYYRLAQVNADGGKNHSPVKALQFTGQWLVKMYPNPAQSFLVLEFDNDKEEKGAIVIQNTMGSTVFATNQQLAKGLNHITLNQIQPLAQGTYVVTLVTNENIFRSKFVKGGY